MSYLPCLYPTIRQRIGDPLFLRVLHQSRSSSPLDAESCTMMRNGLFENTGTFVLLAGFWLSRPRLYTIAALGSGHRYDHQLTPK